MNATATAHPDAARLAAYGAGRLAPADAGEVEEHLRGCNVCGERMDELARDPFLSALRDAAGFSPPHGSGCAVDAPTVACFGDATVVPEELAAHSRYRLGELLGRGGMGAVYKAEHTLMERPVAIKLIDSRLLEQPGSAERFKTEVKTAARLHHPNIVTAHDAEQVGSVTVLVMEFVEGRTLADVLRDRGPLPVAEACEYARQAALGLAHAHALGMVHRDVKPHNLMLTPDGRVKILDFGLARFLSEEPADGDTHPAAETGEAPVVGRLTQTGACMGTLDYMAPEQTKDARTADARADVYSLGCTLYHLLAGQVPFPGGSGPDKLHRIRTEEPAPLSTLRPDAPPKLSALIGRMMAKTPEERYASAADVADSLARFARAAEPRPAVSRRRPWKRFTAVAALVLAGVAVATILTRSGPGVATDSKNAGEDVGKSQAHPLLGRGPQLPAELNAIPRTAAGFVTTRVGDLTRVPSQSWVWPEPDKGFGDRDQNLTGFREAGLTRATVIWPPAAHPDIDIYGVPPEKLSRILLLTRTEPFPLDHPAFEGRGKTREEYRGRWYALDSDGWTAFYPVDPHTLAIGSRAAVRFLLDHLADPRPGPLDDAVRTAADSECHIVVGIHGRPFTRAQLDKDKVPWLFLPPKPFPGVRGFAPDHFTVTLDCRRGLEFGLVAAFPNEGTAEQAREALAEICAHQSRVFRGIARAGDKVVEQVAGADPDGRSGTLAALYDKQNAFYLQAGDALLAAKPVRDSSSVRLAVRTESALPFEEALREYGGYAFLPSGGEVPLESPVNQERRDATLARALAAYRADHGRFPPPAITDETGKPLLSWRVAVLPYLGEEAAALYRRFRLDEPWDSPANRVLVEPMPAVLSTAHVVPTYRPRPGSAYRVFAVPGAHEREPAGGRANPPPDAVIAVRGWDDSRVPWTKPDAPTPDDLKELPAAVIRADGSVREVQRTEDLSVLRATIRQSALTAALPVAPAPRAVVVRPIPPELDLIPRDAAGFLTVPVQEVMTAPSLAWARKRLFPDGELARMVGLVTQLDLKDITRATVIWPTADHIGWNVMAVPGEVPSRLVVLTAASAIDKSNHWLQGGKGNEEYRGRRYTLDGDGWTAIFLADDRTLVFGSHASVRLVIDRLADPKPGPLDSAVRTAADGPNRVVVGAQGPKFRRVLADNLPQDMQLAAPAYTADRVTIAIDFRDGFTIESVGEFATEAAAGEGHAALVKAFAVGADEFARQVEKFPPDDATDPERLEEQKQYRDFLTQTRDAFRVAKPERDGTRLRLTFVSKSAFAAAMVLPGFGYVLMPTGPTHFDPAVAGKNDATVAKALLAYHAKHGRFPPPAILSKEGKPLLSWRVALLPHLGDEAAALYKKFNLEEAWDSPANKKLLDQMPAELCTDPLKTDYRPRPRTGYRVYTAKGSVFEGPAGLSKKDITDDPAATILAVRHAQSVPWTKPDRLTFDNLEAIPSAAIFADGAVRQLADNEDPNTLKAMITRAGGETVKLKSDPIRQTP